MTFEDVREEAITPAEKSLLAAVSHYIAKDPRAVGKTVGESLKAHAGRDRITRPRAENNGTIGEMSQQKPFWTKAKREESKKAFLSGWDKVAKASSNASAK